jgi:hypothetical protein
MKNDRIKNNRIKSDRLKNDRIKSDLIKTDRIKSITDPLYKYIPNSLRFGRIQHYNAC